VTFSVTNYSSCSNWCHCKLCAIPQGNSHVSHDWCNVIMFLIEMHVNTVDFICLSTVSHKKGVTWLLAINFAKCFDQISKSFHCKKEDRSFQQNVHKDFHHTLNVLLHYLVKWKRGTQCSLLFLLHLLHLF